MDKYKQLAKLVILEILHNLNIEKKADSFYYKLNVTYYSQNVDKLIPICDDDDKIFNLLGLTKDGLEECTCEKSTYKYFSEGKFYGKDFMELLKISQGNKILRGECRFLWRECIHNGYQIPIRDKIDDETLYVKMIDRFCKSNVEKVLKQEAAARIRYKSLGTMLSIANISEWSRYKTAKEANDVRDRFFEHIKDFYVGDEFPIEQYLTDTSYRQTKTDFESFLKQEDLRGFSNAHNST